ncbi:MAG: nitroreductase family deazaflavin-dependent oxidoreductase [Chloroflexi bacterium]|nr:MAG: nitroreductase family deazaflavin-dependent oxidoreductase [Chloroflexota bacterium]
MSDRDETAKPQRPAIPQDMKAFNRDLIEEWRANDGQLSGRMAGRNLILLTTIGVRSGEPRTVVLGFGRHGDSIVAIASNNGAPSDPAWYHNLLGRPTATVELGPDRFEVRWRTARPEERSELAKTVPYLESQQQLTEREIPIVVLERTAT